MPAHPDATTSHTSGVEVEDVARVVAEARTHREAGERAEAMRLLEECLAEARRAGDDLLACYVLHDLGHTEIEPTAQLGWHLDALAAADAVGDQRVAGFYPSLHLNLAITYQALGNREKTREHLDAAEIALPQLADADGEYGRFVRSGVAAFRTKFDAEEEGGGASRPAVTPSDGTGQPGTGEREPA
jgi:hypothetical protein